MLVYIIYLQIERNTRALCWVPSARAHIAIHLPQVYYTCLLPVIVSVTHFDVQTSAISMMKQRTMNIY